MKPGNIISIIVPCFNEEKTIGIFIENITPVLSQIYEKFSLDYEIIFVNDGSHDNTQKILNDLNNNDPKTHFISFSRNFGKEAALYAGIKKSCGKYVCTIDVDMQDPPSLIPVMLEFIINTEGYDCAGSRRVTRKGEPPIRSFFAKIFYKLISQMADIDIVDGVRDFRVMKRKMADAFLSLTEHNRFSKGIFPWLGFKTKYFEFKNVKRSAGETKWSFWKLLLYSFDAIAAFSIKPLSIASFSGIVLFFIAILIIVFLIIRKILFGDPVAGWPSLVCIIIFCSGIQLISTGILGQYLAKAYIEIKQRPLYIIDEEK
jgi:glycosyltransferase involved in cell wall biosynthesis